VSSEKSRSRIIFPEKEEVISKQIIPLLFSVSKQRQYSGANTTTGVLSCLYIFTYTL